jgi:enolase-phosphatase E1
VIGTIVLDIEGTTSSTAFVTRTLFPYSRAHFAEYIAGHRDDAELAPVMFAIRAELGDPNADDARIVHQLEAWVDADAKVEPLKAVQGWIWQEGFARGDLVAHFYPDVVPVLRRWHADGYELAVYSSGSVVAQRAWFGHSAEGDLTPLIAHNFDIENAGPKRDADSYRKIAGALGREPATLLFASDLTAELDAARAAGWHTIGVRRPGEPNEHTGVGDHLAVASFAEIEL